MDEFVLFSGLQSSLVIMMSELKWTNARLGLNLHRQVLE